MDHFSISELSRLSGIKAYTIRIWEKRYQALSPDRTEGNTRVYNNKQLRRLLNIAGMMELGYKVSDLCAMSDVALFRLVQEKKEHLAEGLEGFFISQLISSGFTYDEPHFTSVFAQCVARFGVKDAYVKVLYPMLQRIGILWNSDRINPGNEHFITNLLRQKILTAIDMLSSPVDTADTWMLFLPENEFHETGLMIAHYLIRHSGQRSVYLGANVPQDALKAAAEGIRPNKVLFFFVQGNTKEELNRYLRSVAVCVKHAHIYAAGKQLIGQLSAPRRTQFLESVADLEKLLN